MNKNNKSNVLNFLILFGITFISFIGLIISDDLRFFAIRVLVLILLSFCTLNSFNKIKKENSK